MPLLKQVPRHCHVACLRVADPRPAHGGCLSAITHIARERLENIIATLDALIGLMSTRDE